VVSPLSPIGTSPWSLPSLSGPGPGPSPGESDFGPWFESLAATLLNDRDLVVNGAVHRLAEVEVYYHGPRHADPYAHRHPLQRESGRWYFHRTGTGGRYRGGSFQGLDLTLGDGSAYFGVLIRSVVTPEARVIDGPSLVVDHLLRLTGAEGVAALDRRIAGRSVGASDSPVHLRPAARPRTATVWSSPRVGLSLAQAIGSPQAARFVGRPYRFLTEPRAIRKGKPHLVLALHGRGEKADAVARVTGCQLRCVRRYIAAFEAGRATRGLSAFGHGGKGHTVEKRKPSVEELCRFLGAWAAEFG